MTLPRAESITVEKDKVTHALRFRQIQSEYLQAAFTWMMKSGLVCDPPELMTDEEWVIKFRIPDRLGLFDTLGKIKQVFQPRLAVAFLLYGLQISYCKAGTHSRSAQTSHQYLPRFEPQDEQVFQTALFVRLKEVNLGEFVAPDDEELQKALGERLAEIVRVILTACGATASRIDVEFKPCCTAVSNTKDPSSTQ